MLITTVTTYTRRTTKDNTNNGTDTRAFYRLASLLRVKARELKERRERINAVKKIAYV